MPKVTVDVPKVTRRRAKSDLSDAKTRFLCRLVLKERENFKFIRKQKGKSCEILFKVIVDELRAGK